MTRKKKTAKRQNLTPDQLMQREYDKSLQRKAGSIISYSCANDTSTNDLPAAVRKVKFKNHRAEAEILKKSPEALREANDEKGIVTPALLSISQTCDLLNIKRTTLYRLERDGLIPGRIELRGSVRYHRETVEGWLRDIMAGKQLH